MSQKHKVKRGGKCRPEAEPGCSFQHRPLPVIFLTSDFLHGLTFVLEFAVFQVQLSELGLNYFFFEVTYPLEVMHIIIPALGSKDVRVEGLPQWHKRKVTVIHEVLETKIKPCLMKSLICKLPDFMLQA